MRHPRLERPARAAGRCGSQFSRWRRDRGGGDDFDPACRQYRDCSSRTRDPARGRRLRHPSSCRLQPATGTAGECDGRGSRRAGCDSGTGFPRCLAAARTVLPVTGDRQLLVRRDVGSDSGSASRHLRRQSDSPGPAGVRRHRDGYGPVMDAKNLATVQKMWQREVEAAATYRHLADRERDPKRRDILNRLVEQEEKHAARWSERIQAATGTAPDPKEVERGLSWFQRISDPNVVLHRLEQEENKAEAEYDQLMRRLSNPTDRQIAEEAMLEERDHAVVLRTLAGGKTPTPRSTLDSILGRERWHVRGTGWIGDAIYGVNDGLGAVFGIVSGMAGYTGGSEVVLAAGLAGTLASALSMGAGAYLSSKSQR